MFDSPVLASWPPCATLPAAAGAHWCRGPPSASRAWHSGQRASGSP